MCRVKTIFKYLILLCATIIAFALILDFHRDKWAEPELIEKKQYLTIDKCSNGKNEILLKLSSKDGTKYSITVYNKTCVQVDIIFRKDWVLSYVVLSPNNTMFGLTVNGTLLLDADQELYDLRVTGYAMLGLALIFLLIVCSQLYHKSRAY